MGHISCTYCDEVATGYLNKGKTPVCESCYKSKKVNVKPLGVESSANCQVSPGEGTYLYIDAPADIAQQFGVERIGVGVTSFEWTMRHKLAIVANSEPWEFVGRINQLAINEQCPMNLAKWNPVLVYQSRQKSPPRRRWWQWLKWQLRYNRGRFAPMDKIEIDCRPDQEATYTVQMVIS